MAAASRITPSSSGSTSAACVLDAPATQSAARKQACTVRFKFIMGLAEKFVDIQVDSKRILQLNQVVL
jgi:hypothetical protein